MSGALPRQSENMSWAETWGKACQADEARRPAQSLSRSELYINRKRGSWGWIIVS